MDSRTLPFGAWLFTSRNPLDVKIWIGPCWAYQLSTLWVCATIVPSRPFPDPVNLLSRCPLGGGEGGDDAGVLEVEVEVEAEPCPDVALVPLDLAGAVLPWVSAPGAACFEAPADPLLDVTALLVTVTEPEELLSPQPASSAIASPTIRIAPTPPERPPRNELIENLPRAEPTGPIGSWPECALVAGAA